MIDYKSTGLAELHERALKKRIAELEDENEQLREAVGASRNLVHDVRQVLCVLGANHNVPMERLRTLEQFASTAMNANKVVLTRKVNDEGK